MLAPAAPDALSRSVKLEQIPFLVFEGTQLHPKLV